MIARPIDALRGKLRMPAFIERRHVQAARARLQSDKWAECRSSGERQLLIDVSAISQNDVGTGIQRVARAALVQLLAEPPAGYIVRPVAATPRQSYRHIAWGNVDAEPECGRVITVKPGDIFLGLDLSAHIIPNHHHQLAEWKARGAAVHFIVYDLLPLQHPEWFSGKLISNFRHWIKSVAMLADSAICISRTVEADLTAWLESRYGLAPGKVATRVIPLGWDIASTMPSQGLPPNFGEILAQMRQRKTALIVGTIEPRKAHAQVLAAFERLWSNGEEYNLAIVGRPGWKTESLQEKLRNHPERNRRLFWFDNASDEALLALYRACDGVIVASLAEGFGLPLVEAIGHGKPVLARDLPVFREVGGNVASYFSRDGKVDLNWEISAWLGGVVRETVCQPSPFRTWHDCALELHACLNANEIQAQMELDV